VANDFFAASRAGDDEQVCRNVTAKHARLLVATFAGDTCVEAVRNARKTSAARLNARPRYSSFSTSGQTARLRVTFSEAQFMTNLTFRYINDVWKIDGSGRVLAR
jgi:precorrin-6B methylase 1